MYFRRSYVIVTIVLSSVFAIQTMAADQDADRVVKAIEQEVRANRRSRPSQDFVASDKSVVRLTDELKERFPQDARLPALLPERWWAMLRLKLTAEAKTELNFVIDKSTNKSLQIDAIFVKTAVDLDDIKDGPSSVLACERFIKLAPKDDRAASLLTIARMKFRQDDPEGIKLDERIIKDFPDSLNGRLLTGEKKQIDRVGKPFELEFVDAISGREVSIRKLRGKVVVLDFWATWCGPCVAEIPHFKELYRQYKDKGVEFIGISLDLAEEDGGLESLRKYVHEHDIKWPQYYLGEKFTAEFSKSWGIGSIPVSFVIDAEGNLFSAKARGKLDEIIPTLLNKK